MRYLLLLPLLWACSTEEPSDPTGAGGVAWTTSASGGAGATSSSAGGSGTGGVTSAGGSAVGGEGGTGGAARLEALVVATGQSSFLQGRFDGARWSVTESAGPTSALAPALSFVADVGLAVIAEGSAGSSPLVFATYEAGWSSFADSTATARAAPALAAGALAYHAADFKHAFGLYAGGFSPIAEPIAAPAAPQSFGPTAPALTLLGGNPVVAFAGDDGMLYVQSRAAGTWAAAASIPQSAAQTPPALVALSAGPELLAVWVHHEPSSTDHTKLFWSTRTAGAWTTPTKISEQIFTPDAPSLAPLTGGDAVLAFRGTDGMGYTLRFAAGAWGSVAPLNAAVLSTPDLAPGASGADAEAAYVTTGGVVEHARLTGDTWSTPSILGGTGLVHAAIATL